MKRRPTWQDVARDWPPKGGAAAHLDGMAALYGDVTSVYLELPWPPSVNTYWRHVVVGSRVRVVISAKGRAYRQAVIAAVVAQTQPDRRIVRGRLAVDITAYPPDKRKRDLDNLPKAVLDALEAAGVYADDSAIDELRVRRSHEQGQGIEVLVNKIPAATEVFR